MQGAVKLLFTFRHGGQQCSKNACSPTKGVVTQRAAEPPPTRHVHGCVSGKNDLCGSEPLGSRDWLSPRHALASATSVRHGILRSKWELSREREGILGTGNRAGGRAEEAVGGGACEPSRNPQDCTRAQRLGSPAAFPLCTALLRSVSTSLTASSEGQSCGHPACQQGPGQCPELRMRSVMLPNSRRWTVLWMLSGRGQVLSSSPWPPACKPGLLPEASRL